MHATVMYYRRLVCKVEMMQPLGLFISLSLSDLAVCRACRGIRQGGGSLMCGEEFLINILVKFKVRILLHAVLMQTLLVDEHAV